MQTFCNAKCRGGIVLACIKDLLKYRLHGKIRSTIIYALILGRNQKARLGLLA